MLRNYFITALRSFMRSPVYSIINVSGLVLGLACSLFILLWVVDELRYNRYHPDNGRVYKVMENEFHSDGTISTDEYTPGILAGALKAEFGEVEQTSRMTWTNDRLFRLGDKSTYEYGAYADASHFEVLNISILEGNSRNIFPDNHSIAISKKLADKFFPASSPIGHTFKLDDTDDFTVTAVFDFDRENATEEFDFVMPMELYIKQEHIEGFKWLDEGWMTVYVKLKDKHAQKQVDEKIKNLFKKHDPKIQSELFLFPMEQWRLYNHFENGKQSGGRINYVISFSVVAIFILLIACINFMNLSTARSAVRAKEVGVRKVTGASRGLLIRQFITESVLLSFISLFVALLIVHLLLPAFNNFTNKQLFVNYADPVISGSLFSIALLTGLLAGSYPAFFLSSVRPVAVLKSQSHPVFKGATLRKMLVVFQFSLSMIVIVCALVINNQISFMRKMNVGFDRRNILILDINPQLSHKFQAFRNRLLQEPAIESVGMGAATPIEINGSESFDWSGKAPNDDTYFNIANCDYDYINTLGFKLVEGRNFSHNFPADTANYIVTEQVVKAIGFKDPIGQHMTAHGHDGIIVGVIKDFHNLGVREKFHPTVLTLAKNPDDLGDWANIFIRYKEGTTTETLARVEKIFKTVSDFPMRYRFLDSQYEWKFRLEIMTATLANWFTGMALVISCLGLFGLALFSTERRTKEISIRKVFGATVSRLAFMLCKDFIRLVIYSILIGLPIAFYLADKILAEYLYHTQLSTWMFLIPTVAMLLLSISIISVQSVKAALTNPVDAMRSE